MVRIEQFVIHDFRQHAFGARDGLQFVEFFGEGISALSLADRATVANMAPEYGATMGFFPVDERSLDYLRLTGRDEAQIDELREAGILVEKEI